MTDQVIRLLLVNQIRLMCNVLAAALEDENDIDVIGCATSIDEAVGILSVEDVDVVLVSTQMRDHGALRLTELVSAKHPDVNVVVLGIAEKKERVLQFIETGAVGYVLRDDSVEEMLTAIRAPRDGVAKVSPLIASAMIDRLAELAQMFSSLESGVIESAGLTSRELEVLTLLGQNMTNQEIADQLIIEVGTVKNHVHSILDKLNVSSRSEAAAYLALIRKQE
jgi:DNA-binding NarL/FixJ family response regulator